MIVSLSLLISGCTPATFLIQKGNSMAYYFGTESRGAYKLLCESGDLKKVLRDAELPEDIKNDFYEYTCTESRSKEKVFSLYTFLTPEEKKSLKQAFVRHNYTINSVPC